VSDPDLIRLFVEPLEAIGVSYMITGGVASVIYGDPRFTRDVDIVMELHGSKIAALESAFDPAAMLKWPAPRRDVSCLSDVYLAGNDPLIGWGFGRRVRLRLGGAEIWVAPIEYVILRKLEYYEQSGSDRHLRDVAMMFRISGDTVDTDELLQWAEQLDLLKTLERARRFSPDH